LGGSHSLLNSHPEAERQLAAWFDQLAAVRILDPACGSGNFLYVALRRLLDLWKDARDFAIQHNIQIAITYAVQKMPSPTQLYGIETEFYAHELASIVVWIGFLQWKHEHGITEDREPILQKLSNIEHADAILRYDQSQTSPEHPNGKPYEPIWPAADYIIGNPPFLGGKLLRRELGDKYVDDLFDLYKGRVKAESDLVVYWFEKSRAQLEASAVNRVGLLATQGIRAGANRNVLERIQQVGTIFWAWSEREWLLQGAAVRVSMIGFKGGQAISAKPAAQAPTARHIPAWAEGPGAAHPEVQGLKARHITPPDADPFPFLLDDQPVPFINPDLTTGSNTASALRLKENECLCFMGTTKVGAFDIDAETARKMLSAPLNPNGRPNSDVVRPWVNALDITRRPRNMFIIDFGTDMTEAAAALYEMPFEYVKHHVKPIRAENNREAYATNWWIFAEPRPAMRKALRQKRRALLTPRVSKYRFFDWMASNVIPDSRLFVFALDSDYGMGTLHSRVHEEWALSTSSRHGVAGDITYNGASCFDTFPFPWPPGTEPSEAEDPRVKAIADAARELVRLRDAWLNPPNASEADLKDRTLTKLYNLRAAGKCAWLENAHRTLDEAVFVAYGWPSSLSTQQILANLLALNHQRAAAEESKPAA
jgi:type II restriction/modification system DNA methylase subunit YeeA